MFGFIKGIVVLALLAALGYFAFFVQIGDRTLYRHLVGISQTDEAKALKDGLSDKASDIKNDVISKLPADRREKREAKTGSRDERAPLSEQTDADKHALKRLLERAANTPEKK
jgi:hypothetical protein